MNATPPDVLRCLLEHSQELGDRRIAFADETRELTYADLRIEVEDGARALLTSGIRAGGVVAASLPSSVDAVVLFLSVLRAGGVWVGIDPRTPTATCDRIVSDYDATLIDAETWQTVRQDATAYDAAILPPISDPDLPAAVAFTSGTTGAPKPIVHTRSDISLVASAYAGLQAPGLRVGVCLSLSILNLQILGTCAGIFASATTIVLRRMDARSVADSVWQHRLQKLCALVPATVYDLVHDATISPDMLRTLTDAGCGAAALPEAVQQKFEAKFGLRIVGSYGLTEAPAVVAAEDSTLSRVPGASGRPLPHVHLEILDEHGVRVTNGVEGIIWLSPRTDGPFGDMYRRCAWRWADHAFHRVPDHDRSLRTGDIGRLDQDGNLTVVGRESDILIRGGVNISSAELERTFSDLPEVAGVGVVGLPDDRLGHRVVVLVEPSEAFARPEYRESLFDRLDGIRRNRFIPTKAPDRIVIVDKLPRNAMGKVARSELAAIIPD